MSEQESTRRASRQAEETAELPATDVVERKAKIDVDVDAMLDEIDGVLEENAEEFVRGFVQKGGQ